MTRMGCASLDLYVPTVSSVYKYVPPCAPQYSGTVKWYSVAYIICDTAREVTFTHGMIPLRLHKCTSLHSILKVALLVKLVSDREELCTLISRYTFRLQILSQWVRTIFATCKPVLKKGFTCRDTSGLAYRARGLGHQDAAMALRMTR